ncbi:MAG TPA: hypothetical protein EYQ45_03750 [Flavobacteriaceae bacterium]|jgi:hypothetical protein|nr:hypothetical protein [Flavobacteriaceae bacterium]
MDKKYTYKALKAKHRELREVEKWDQNFKIRTHRALSWLKRSELEGLDTSIGSFKDLDAQFIFLWISFNSAYSHDISTYEPYKEKSVYKEFINRIVYYDDEKEHAIYKILWEEFPKNVESLIDNKFIFQPYWNYRNGKSDQYWEGRFKDERRNTRQYREQLNVAKLLMEMLNRLYCLRNQMVHGGATHDSDANREQVSTATPILANLVPIIINVMMDNPKVNWGKICYPPISS